MSKERKLKVYSQTRTSNSTGYFSQTGYSEVPAILLSGKWLEAAGFSISDHIKVSVDDGKHLPVPVLMQHSKTYIFHVDGKVGSFSLLQGPLLTSLIITLLPLPFPYYLSKTKNQPLPYFKKGVSSSVSRSNYMYYS